MPLPNVTFSEAERALRNSKLFAGMSDATIAASAREFTLREVPRGKNVFSQGDPSTHLYCLVRGALCLGRLTEDGSEFTSSVLGRGDLLGIDALFANGSRLSTATALNDCIVAACPAESMKALLERHAPLWFNVANCLYEQQERTVARIERLLYSRVRERLLTFLSELAAECGVAEDGGTRIAVNMTHLRLASLIGATRETVSSALGDLSRRGHLMRRGRQIVVRFSAPRAA